MKEFVSEENIEFISLFREAKTNLEQENKPVQPLIEEFQKILEEIKEEKLLPLIKLHDDGEDGIKNFTASVNRLRGFGALKFGQKFENLPDFNADSFLQQYKDEKDYKLDVDLSFTEVLPDDMDDYDSIESPIRFSYGKQNIRFSSPYNEEEIIEAKKNHLIEQTNQEPDFNPSKSKSYPPRIVKTMDIKIKDTTVEALEDVRKITVQEVKLLRNKNDKLTGKFEAKGAEFQLKHADFITLGQAGLADRNNTMIENGIYDLGEKGFVKIVKGNFQGSGRRIRADRTTEDDVAKKFFKMLKSIEETVIQPILENPYRASIFRGEVHFKTKRDVNNSMTRKIERLLQTVGKGKKSDWKAGKDEDGIPQFIQSVEVMVDGKYKRLSVQEAQKLEGEAWTNKDTKKKIGNAEYMAMNDNEKNAYAPSYYIITIDGSMRTPTNEISTTHRNILEYRLKDAPDDAYAEKPKGFIRRFKKSNKRGDFGVAYSGFKRFLTEEEGNKKKQEMEERQAEEDKNTNPSKFTSFEEVYREGVNYTFEGDFITREEYERLSDDDKRVTRKVTLSPRRVSSLLSTDKSDYNPVYDERELKPDNEEDAKELEFRRVLQQRAEKKRARKPATIQDPSKFGKVTDKAYAVVTGEDYHLSPLVSYANIQDAFSNIILHIELVVEDIGEFTLSPAQRRRNDSMVNVIEENLTVLEEVFGE